MFEILSDFFQKQKIRDFAPVSLASCRRLRPYLLERVGIKDTGTAVLFAVPYLSRQAASHTRNISSYAVPLDYHLFFSALFDELLPLLRNAFPQYHFAGFADHSPIDEVHAAALAGLGMIGRHGLLITPQHSSYVFLGEVITDMILPTEPREIAHCPGCGACTRACPAQVGETCLSALSQKKGTLTEKEAERLMRAGSAWGCDLCQEACPFTREAERNGTLDTELPFFQKALIPNLSQKMLLNMSDDDFACRAYAWRTKETIARNLDLIEKGDTSC